MLKIVLVGTGNVASHLLAIFLETKGIAVVQVFGRNKEALKAFSSYVPTTANLENVVPSDIYLIAVSDKAIATVAKTLEAREGIVAHTSGSVPLEVLPQNRAGVFYPLQTFTLGKKLDFKTIPICIEAKTQQDFNTLTNLAKLLSHHVHHITSEQRKKLHLAAVFANNFSNHLFQMAAQLCEAEKLPFELLKPLIFETAEKLHHLSPKEAQTGPARRNDLETMQKHLTELESPLQRKIYQLLSESIKATYEKKL